MAVAVEVTDTNHGSVIFGGLPDLYIAESYCDVTFYCKGGRSVKSHRVFLSAVSPFLAGLFYEQKFRDVIEISLPDFDYEDIDNFLRFLYEGVIRLQQGELDIFTEIRKTLEVTISVIVQAEEKDEKLLERLNTKKRKFCDKMSPNESKPSKVQKTFNNPAHERQDVVSCFNSIIENFKSTTPNKKSTAPNKKFDSGAREARVTHTKEGPLLVSIAQFKTVTNIIERRRLQKNVEEIVAVKVKQEIERIKEEQKEKRKSMKSNKSRAHPNLSHQSTLPAAHKPSRNSTDTMSIQLGVSPSKPNGTSKPSKEHSVPQVSAEISSSVQPKTLGSNQIMIRLSHSPNTSEASLVKGYNLYDSPRVETLSPLPRSALVTKTYNRKGK